MEAKDVFEILAREHEQMLWAYLRSVVYDQHAAEDLYQEALLVAWNRLPDYDRERPFGAWLRGIARNLVLAYIRKHGRSKVMLVDEQALDGIASRYEELETLIPGDWEGKLEALRRCMAALGKHDLEVVQRHYQGAQDCQQIATGTGIGLEAVKKRLQRARASLAACVKRRTGEKAVFHGA